jgi:tRNA-splicing ligase RtcB
MNVYQGKGKRLLFSTVDLNDIEAQARFQLVNARQHPSVVRMGVMPDCHAGYDIPIGTMVASTAAFPRFAGVDGGCGVLYGRLYHWREKRPIRPDELDLEQVVERIYESVPVGNGPDGSRKEYYTKNTPSLDHLEASLKDEVEYEVMLRQVGTLGGGNHFIELDVNEREEVCFMIHTGSRKAGHTIGSFYEKVAEDLMDTFYVSDAPSPFLPCGIVRSNMYLQAQEWTVEYAKLNRYAIAKHVIQAICDALGADRNVYECERVESVHNFVETGTLEGQDVFIHRKGAIRLPPGELGVIPGHMGGHSFVVRGVESEWAEKVLHTAPHGAGRVMGRREAKRELDLEEQQAIMKGIVNRLDAERLDEAPGAYKDPDEVIRVCVENELLEVVEVLSPIANVKG